MKNLFLIVLSSFIIGCSGSKDSTPKKPTYWKAEFNDEADEFTGENKATLKTFFATKEQTLSDFEKSYFKSLAIESQNIIVGSTRKKGQELSDSDKFMFISMTNNGWKYLRCNQIYFLIDGEKFQPESEHEGSVLTGSAVMETLYIKGNDTQKLINLIANSKENVRFKICNDEFYIPSIYVKDFDKFASN